MVPIRKAYSYIRFSTPEQQKGDSYRRQYELSRAYAEAHGLVLDEALTYKDFGVSAFNKSNILVGQLGEFLNAIESGVVESGSYLLVESLDRLSRAQISDALEVFLSILRNGVTIVTLADGMEYSKEKMNSNFTDLIVSIVIMSRAHEESLMKSKRLKQAWIAKRREIGKKKLTALAPGWLKLNADRTAYLPMPERVEIVLRVFSWSKGGIGDKTIAMRLNQMAVPPFNERRAGMWHSSYIQKILNSRAVLGEYQPHIHMNGKRIPEGDPISDYFPRIISDAEYVETMQLRKARRISSIGRKGKSFSNLFSGVLRCGYCNGSMLYVNKGHIGPRAKLLVCSNAKGGKGCHYIPWEYEYFEKSILTYCKGLDFAEFLQPRNGIKSEMAILNAKISELEALIDSNEMKSANILKAIEEGASFVQYQSRAQQLEQERLKLDAELNQVRVKYNEHANVQVDIQAVQASIDGLIEKMKDLEGDELYDLRAMLSQRVKKLVARIAIFPGGYIEKPEHLKRLREHLLQKGHSEYDVDTFILDKLKTAPNASERFFMMVSRNASIRLIHPASVSPDVLQIETGVDSVDEGMAMQVENIRMISGAIEYIAEHKRLRDINAESSES